MSDPDHRISYLGERALLFDVAGPMSLEVQRHIWAFARALDQRDEVKETVPGVHSVLTILHDKQVVEAFEPTLARMWDEVQPLDEPSRLIEVPVSYGGEMGEALADIAAGRDLTIREVVDIHSAPEYTVFALGSQPGLATPRRKTPRLSVVAGSIIIGGAQAGVLSRTSPSGWHIIGHTELSFFDPDSETPSLIAPGDRIRFCPVEVLS
ncbi:5-oxoprolinase subunit PxpB [Breoghania sp.]|uniref:5-oxoprolinase subunit PxpB n=1 Tax=Breoghania sp. TaxID=2065378 RepID=UPI00260F5A7A|nr:5-oxoprolinase subunit PxpB [Breoghania sp.]MDJ0930720.1 5-oxoprolinase subunit PxpB [Breoghania sp.]